MPMMFCNEDFDFILNELGYQVSRDCQLFSSREECSPTVSVTQAKCLCNTVEVPFPQELNCRLVLNSMKAMTVRQ